MTDEYLPTGRGAVVGCGSIGTRHLENLLELGATDVVAVDVDPDRRDALAAEYGVRTATFEDALELDLAYAVVSVPTASHVEVATELAERGCHLLIEKPVSHEREGVAQLLDIVHEQGLVTLIGFNMRFHPAVRTMKSLVENDAVGAVLSARVESGSYLPDWRPGADYRESYSAVSDLGGGVVLDMVHEFDYARWLLGPVARVSCFHDQVSDLDIDSEDVAESILRFETGAIAEVHVDYVQRPASRSCQLIGESGTVRWSHDSGTVRWYNADRERWESTTYRDEWEHNDMYLDQTRHFLACIAGDAEPICDVADGFASTEVALAAKESAERRRHVRLE